MMSVNRRFFALEDSTSVTEFFIDTTKTTASSQPQDSLRFQLPISQNFFSGSGFVISVDDGRADIPVRNLAELNAHSTLYFANPGIYKIRLIGSVLNFSCYSAAGVTYDINKIIKLTRIGKGFKQGRNQWRGCVNMDLALIEPVVLDVDAYGMFIAIKKVTCDLNSNFILSKVEILDFIFQGITESLSSVLNPFLPKVTSIAGIYQACTFSGVSKIEIISNNITSAGDLFRNSSFRGRLELKTPNLNSIINLVRGYTNPPALGGVDIRNLTSCENLVYSLMSKANVDSTILEWANGYDWSAIPNIPNKVSINFNLNTGSSTCSNTPEVVTALNFLKSKGYLFPYLTAV